MCKEGPDPSAADNLPLKVIGRGKDLYYLDPIYGPQELNGDEGASMALLLAHNRYSSFVHHLQLAPSAIPLQSIERYGVGEFQAAGLSQ